MPEPVSCPSQEADHLGAPAAGIRQWQRVFPGHRRELSQVRRWLSWLLPECAARDDLLSVATELGGNALEHTASGNPGGSFTVEVAWRQSVVYVAVTDGGSPDQPRVIEDLDGERGRGLLLVQGLSARTGWTGNERGRVVWAQIAWPDDAGVVPDASGDLCQMTGPGNQAVQARPFEDGAHPGARCCRHVFAPACPVGAAGLGRRRLSEIDAALVVSGFALADAASFPRRGRAGSGEDGARPHGRGAEQP
jgi:serine/threonine-protein kinase RsbW